MPLVSITDERPQRRKEMYFLFIFYLFFLFKKKDSVRYSCKITRSYSGWDL